MNNLYRTLVLITFLMVVSCVTTKKKGETRGLKRAYANVTAHYNGYFNANVLVNEATEKLRLQHQDIYTRVLDIYPEVYVDNPQMFAPDLDKAIEKVAVVTAFHRSSHWVDDCYLMMGKSQYLKHDYEAAQETFEYLTEMYNPELRSKVNRKENAKAAAEARKEAAKVREDERKEKQKENEKLIKERNEARKEAAKSSKEERESKQKELEKRNEERRKANEEKQKERERLRKEAEKAGQNAEKTQMTTTGSNNTPVVKTEAELKKVTPPKKKKKKENYFFRHRPCYQEGAVWLARTYIERGLFTDAEILLNELERNPNIFKATKQKVAVTRGHLYLRQNNYEAAIPALETAVKLTKKKRDKVRYQFILAQLYQTTQNSQKAYAAYEKVLKGNPTYEMEFNTRLNMAISSNASASEAMTSTLLRMAKDSKNKEYGDQIYYALAQIALKNKERAKAMTYLRQALDAPSRNRVQKGEAYYLLAKMNLEDEKYVFAKNYFDSTAQSLAAKDTRIEEATRYATNLADIARNLEIIEKSDSLLKIAKMSKEERTAFALKMKKQRIATEVAAIRAANTNTGGGATAINVGNSGKNASNFFAYNPELVKKAQQDFKKKWGNDRKLEDDWRRSNKRTGNGTFRTNDAVADANDITPDEVAKILKGVPITVEEIQTMEQSVDNAVFQLGTLYHDKLQNNKKTVETLEGHLKRFPASLHELEDWYYLQLAYNEMGSAALAKQYTDRILQKYPNSNYAKVLKDPTSVVKKEETVESFYSTTYKIFKQGNYKDAYDRVQKSETTYGINNPFRAKFSLLAAMCLGNLKGKLEYIAALKDVVAKFAETPEERRAREMLRILESDGNAAVVTPQKIENTEGGDLEANFSAGDDKLHYVIVVLTKEANVEDTKIAVADYNAKFHRLDNYTITSVFLNTEDEVPMIVVRRFKDKVAAQVYTEGVAKNNKEFLKIKNQVFAITQDNYRELLRQKSIDAYSRFYAKNYKK